MKKGLKILTVLALCFSFTGCFSDMYTRIGKNDMASICTDCSQVTDINKLIDNIEYSMNKMGALEGTYYLTNTQNSYEIHFDCIAKEKRVDWDVYAKTAFDGKEVTLYIKDQNIYVVYPNNGANIIIKDKLMDVIDEFEEALDQLNASYDKNNFEEMLTGEKIAGFNFELMREIASYVANKDGTYTIIFEENGKNWELYVSANFMITEVRCEAINFTSKLQFTYPDRLEITYPMGLDFLTVDIHDVKNILEVDSLAELIDPSLKETEEQSA